MLLLLLLLEIPGNAHLLQLSASFQLLLDQGTAVPDLLQQQ
jgi:hypothetical protein